MRFPYESRSYERWAPFLGRVLFAFLFLFAAYGQIPGTQNFSMEVGMTASQGVPLPMAAVTLAFLVDFLCGLALLLGFYARFAAALLVPYVLILGLVFYHHFSDPMQLGFFISHLGLMAGLLYVSVYGARDVAVRKDLPEEETARAI